jgi:hypothetical protein
MLDGFEQRVEKALTDPATEADSVCHITYPDLVADPAGVIRGVYSHFSLPLDGVEGAVRAWLDDPGNRSDRFGHWTYDLADHGVSAGEVRERFAAYGERFGV